MLKAVPIKLVEAHRLDDSHRSSSENTTAHGPSRSIRRRCGNALSDLDASEETTPCPL